MCKTGALIHVGSAEDEDEQEHEHEHEENDAMDVDEDEGGDEDDDDEDAEGDNDEDDDGEGEGEGEGDDDNDNDEPGSPSQRRSLPNGGTPGPSDSNPRLTRTSPSPQAAQAAGTLGNLPFRPPVRPEALTTQVYDIIPTIAAPHSTSINAITATPDMRWAFSGGADGYIRKFNWVDTANGKLALTVAQRHPFVDSVTKAGVLLSYWDNEDSAGGDGPSPVYSLAVNHQSLWLLSGTESGNINLQTVRHNEGHRIHTLKAHTSAVSVLTLAADEASVLSGSWDKTINDWDLNTGKVKRRFETNCTQISAIEQRPTSALPIPQEADTAPLPNGTFASNNAARPRANGGSNGVESAARTTAKDEPVNEDAPGSPEDSLFGDGGDRDSLFGDGADNNPSAALPGMGDDDDDDEFSRAIANGIQQAEDDNNGDMDMMDMGGPVQAPDTTDAAEAQPSIKDEEVKSSPKTETADSAPQTNGLPHAEDLPTLVKETPSLPPSSESTFFSSSIDGSLAIWDRRQPSPVARLLPPRGTPPWCMNACWSPDGNYIYAGR